MFVQFQVVATGQLWAPQIHPKLVQRRLKKKETLYYVCNLSTAPIFVFLNDREKDMTWNGCGIEQRAWIWAYGARGKGVYAEDKDRGRVR